MTNVEFFKEQVSKEGRNDELLKGLHEMKNDEVGFPTKGIKIINTEVFKHRIAMHSILDILKEATKEDNLNKSGYRYVWSSTNKSLALQAYTMMRSVLLSEKEEYILDEYYHTIICPNGAKMEFLHLSTAELNDVAKDTNVKFSIRHLNVDDDFSN